MARTDVPAIAAPGAYKGESTAVTMTAADPGNGNEFVMTGNDILLIQNTGGSSATWTASSVPDPYGRVEDIATESIAAGALHVFGPIKSAGWMQQDGTFHLTASAAGVKFGVIRLP